MIRERTIPIDYDVEELDGVKRGVARLRLPEKVARNLTDEELPELDRPIRFVVLRGQRGAVRASSLDELQEQLARPWSPDEMESANFDDDLAGRPEREARLEARRAREQREQRFPKRRGGKGKEKPHGRGRSRRRR
jgi:hypothetical protein